MATRNEGEIEPFDFTSSWEIYKERLDVYFLCNDVEDDKKQGYKLLTLGGKDLYTLARSLTAPAKPQEKGYAALVTLLNGHFIPTPNKTTERYKFSQRSQVEGETVAQYLAELRRLAMTCEFAPTELDSRICDRLVVGLRDTHITDKLLNEKDLSLTKAVELANKCEASKKSLQELRQGTPQAVNRVQFSQKPNNGASRDRQSSIRCYRCAGYGHKSNECKKHLAHPCTGCGATGHVVEVCFATNNSRPQKKKTRPFQHRKKTYGNSSNTQVQSNHALGVSDPDVTAQEDGIPFFQQNTMLGLKPITIDVTLDSAFLTMELDTGSAVTAISEDTYLTLFQDKPLTDSEITLRPYDGRHVVPLGKFEATAKYNGKEEELTVYVIRNGGSPLAGRDLIRKFQVSLASFHYVDSFCSLSLEELIKSHERLFESTLGLINAPPIHLRVKPDAESLS